MNADGSGQTQITALVAGRLGLLRRPLLSRRAVDRRHVRRVRARRHRRPDSPGRDGPDSAQLPDRSTCIRTTSPRTASGSSSGAIATATGEIYSIAVNGTDVRNLTNTPSIGGNTDDDAAPGPSWDGLNRIAFTSRSGGDQELYLMNADGSAASCQLTTNTNPGDEPRHPPSSRPLACQGKVATIVGTSASETLTGGPGRRHHLRPAAARIRSAAWAATTSICGDAGKDTLNGRQGQGRPQRRQGQRQAERRQGQGQVHRRQGQEGHRQVLREGEEDPLARGRRLQHQRRPEASKPPGCGSSRFGRKAAIPLCMESATLQGARYRRARRVGRPKGPSPRRSHPAANRPQHVPATPAEARR